MAQLEDGNEKVTNSVIPNGTEAKVMRNLIENKGLLNGKGKLYAGTDDITSTGAPVTTAIDPKNASEGSVLIKDSSQAGGWKVDRIGPTNIIPKSLTGAQLADGAIDNSKLDITDQIKISPSYTTSSSSYPTILSAYTAPYGSSKTVMVRFPRYSGTLVTEDDVAEQYVKRDLITTECNGDYKLPNGTIVGPNGVDITLQFIGPEHMNGGDFAGIVTNVAKAENAISWEGSVKSWDSSGKIVLNLKDSTQMLTRLPWDIQVTYYQSAYSAVNAEKTSFSNSEWQDGGTGSSIKEAAIEVGSSYQIRMAVLSPTVSYAELTNIVTIPGNSSSGEIAVGSCFFQLSSSGENQVGCYYGSVWFDRSKRTMKPQCKLYNLKSGQVADFAVSWWYRKIN